MSRKAASFLVLFCYIKLLQGEAITFQNPIRFPYGGSFMGLFLAIALPLELPDIDIFFSYNIEAAYLLPENQTEFTYPPLLTKRNMDRNFVYSILEYKLNSHGYSGKNCLLRTICEATEYSTQHTGILGDILHIILTPSASKNIGLPREYVQAEKFGRSQKHCKKYHEKCPFSLLQFISWIGKLY